MAGSMKPMFGLQDCFPPSVLQFAQKVGLAREARNEADCIAGHRTYASRWKNGNTKHVQGALGELALLCAVGYGDLRGQAQVYDFTARSAAKGTDLDQDVVFRCQNLPPIKCDVKSILSKTGEGRQPEIVQIHVGKEKLYHRNCADLFALVELVGAFESDKHVAESFEDEQNFAHATKMSWIVHGFISRRKILELFDPNVGGTKKYTEFLWQDENGTEQIREVAIIGKEDLLLPEEDWPRKNCDTCAAQSDWWYNWLRKTVFVK